MKFQSSLEIISVAVKRLISSDKIATRYFLLPQNNFLMKYLEIWSFIDDFYELRFQERDVVQIGNAGALGEIEYINQIDFYQ